MKERRENFSKILVASSPGSTKQLSLTATESTAAMSWVSSNNDSEREIYSEEGASNSYEDYFYDSDEGSTSGWSSSGSGSSYSVDSTYESASLLSDFSPEYSVAEALLDVRNINIPGSLASISRKAVPMDQHYSLERKTIQTSRARSLYHECKSPTSVKKSSQTREQSHQYLKKERPRSAISRLRADLAAIAERRAMLTSMILSVSELKNQDLDMATTILSVSTVSQSVAPKPASISSRSVCRPPRPPPAKTTRKITPEQGVPKAVYISPSAQTRDTQPESRTGSFGFPSSEPQWGFDARNNELAGDFNWEDVLGGLVNDSRCGSGFYSDSKADESDLKDSQSGSMCYSDSRTGLENDFPPLNILFKVEETKPKRQEPLNSRSAYPKPVVRSLDDGHCGGLHGIMQLTGGLEELEDKWSLLETGPRSPQMIVRDYTIPYNIEDRFCGGLYHIASLSSSPSQLAEF
jgi:hypothetical protein